MITCFNSIDSRRQSDGVAVHWSVDGVMSVCLPVCLSLVHSGLSDLNLMTVFSSFIFLVVCLLAHPSSPLDRVWFSYYLSICLSCSKALGVRILPKRGPSFGLVPTLFLQSRFPLRIYTRPTNDRPAGRQTDSTL